MTKPETFQTNIKISFCTITKNEEFNIARCLNSVIPYVDEIILVDTGSDDKTVEIAESLGAQIFYFEWCNDFAAAKNFSIAQATGEWILFLDADEELVINEDYSKHHLLNALNLASNLVFLISRNEIDGLILPGKLPRLFKNISTLSYQGKYHEQLMLNDQHLTENVMKDLDSLKIIHYGYSKDNLKLKASQRIQMLEAISQENFDWNILLTLSAMYQMTEQWDKLQNCYDIVFDQIYPSLISGIKPLDFRAVPAWLVKIGHYFLGENQFENTLLVIQQGNRWYPNYPPIIFLQGEILMALEFYLGAIPYFQFCLNLPSMSYKALDPFVPQYTSVWPCYRLGCAYAELKNWEKARESFEQSLSYDPNYQPAIDAMQRLNAIAPIN